MYLRKINNSKVSEIPMFGGKMDTRPVRGSELINELYPNIFFLGKKKSGKTTSAFHMLKNKVGKKSHVTIISASLYNDNSWKNIRKWLDENDISYDAHTSIIEGEGKEKTDVLRSLVHRLSEDAKDREETENSKRQRGGAKQVQEIYLDAMLGMGEPEKEKKEKKEKYQYPQEIIILDDLGEDMRNPSVAGLVIQNRHYRSMVMLLGQNFHFLTPKARENIDLWCVFGNQPPKIMEELFKDGGITIPENAFAQMYSSIQRFNKKKDAREFFYINGVADDFRMSFDKRFEI